MRGLELQSQENAVELRWCLQLILVEVREGCAESERSEVRAQQSEELTDGESWKKKLWNVYDSEIEIQRGSPNLGKQVVKT